MADEGQVDDVVGVGGDDDLYAAFLAHAQVNVREIQAIWVGVALHGDAVFGGGGEDFLHVVVEGITAQQQATRRMADDLGVRIFDGREHAVGHGRAVEIHVGVNGTDHH